MSVSLKVYHSPQVATSHMILLQLMCLAIYRPHLALINNRINEVFMGGLKIFKKGNNLLNDRIMLHDLAMTDHLTEDKGNDWHTRIIINLRQGNKFRQHLLLLAQTRLRVQSKELGNQEMNKTRGQGMIFSMAHAQRPLNKKESRTEVVFIAGKRDISVVNARIAQQEFW